MRLKQALEDARDENRIRAINSHAGFIRFVTSEVAKHGIKAVLSYPKDHEFYWLKKAYQEVREFAAEYQIKMIPQKLEGSGKNGAFEVTVKIEDDYQASQESGNRISQYIEI